jgi:hypothetical protein
MVPSEERYMTLDAFFRVDGVPCLISDFLETGNGTGGIAKTKSRAA